MKMYLIYENTIIHERENENSHFSIKKNQDKK